MAITMESPRSWGASLAWRQRASCRDLDPNLFFPVGVTGTAIEQIDAARGICEACPVRAACLEFAITTNQEFGVWGGTSEEERRVLRRRWRTRLNERRRASSAS